jgi:hypothetical protein
MSARRTDRVPLGTRLLIVCLAALGVLLLLFAVSRPGVTRFLAAGLVLGAAAVVRHRATHDDPARYGRAAQLRSLLWSVVIVVVFVGASWLLNELITS